MSSNLNVYCTLQLDNMPIAEVEEELVELIDQNGYQLAEVNDNTNLIDMTDDIYDCIYERIWEENFYRIRASNIDV